MKSRYVLGKLDLKSRKYIEDVREEFSKTDKFFESMNPEMPEQTFLEFLRYDQDIRTKIKKTMELPYISTVLDRNDQEAKKALTQAQDLLSEYEQRCIRINRWIMGKSVEEKRELDDKNAERLFKVIPQLEYFLHKTRKNKKYGLSEQAESVLLKSEILQQAILQARDSLESRIKKQRFMHLFDSSDPEQRRSGYTELMGHYRKNIDDYFNFFEATIRYWDGISELRGFKSPASKKNNEYGISDNETDRISDACFNNKQVFWDFYSLKAKILGKERLSRFDMYAPFEKENFSISFSDASRLVLSALKDFNPEFKIKARRVFDEEHIDSHFRSDKVPRSTCISVAPGITPYVITNFDGNDNGSVSDLFSLAHELGHAIHAIYSDHLPVRVMEPSLPLAETASIFSELLLFDKVYNESDNADFKRFILSERISKTAMHLLRMNGFARFEKVAHEQIRKGTTAEELSNTYLMMLKELYGESIDVDPVFGSEWAQIPHMIHRPFYCSTYCFELVALSLYSRHKEVDFSDKLEELLSGGSSKPPSELLAKIGIDLGSEEFLNKGFSVVKGWVKNLEDFYR